MVGCTERDYCQDVLRFELRTLFFRMTVSQYTISVCCIFQNQQPHKQLPQSNIDAASLFVYGYTNLSKQVRMHSHQNDQFHLRLIFSVSSKFVLLAVSSSASCCPS